MFLSRAEYRSRIGNSIGVVQVVQVGATTPNVKNPTLSFLSHFLSTATFGPKRGYLLASGTAVIASRTGWTRCKTMPLVEMARTYPSAGGTFLLCSKGTFLLCRNRRLADDYGSVNPGRPNSPGRSPIRTAPVADSGAVVYNCARTQRIRPPANSTSICRFDRA